MATSPSVSPQSCSPALPGSDGLGMGDPSDTNTATGQPPAQVSVPAIDAMPSVATLWFCLGAWLVTLTVGAAWGLWLLCTLSHRENFVALNLHVANAHGHAQMLGFVGLAIVGFCHHFLPRCWQVPAPANKLSRLVWVAVLAGMGLRVFAMAETFSSWPASAMALAGMGLELGGLALFFGQVVSMFRQSSPAQRHPSDAFILASLVLFAWSVVYESWHTWQTIRAASLGELLHQVATFQAPLRDLQLHGVAILFLLGLFFRFNQEDDKPTPMHRPLSNGQRLGRTWTVFVLLEMALFLTYRMTGHHAWAAMLLLPWLGLWVLSMRAWRSVRLHVVVPNRGLHSTTNHALAMFGHWPRWAMRCGFVWLTVGFTALVLMPALLKVIDQHFSHAYYSAVRQVMTVGVVSQWLFAWLFVLLDGGLNKHSAHRLGAGTHACGMVGMVCLNFGLLGYVGSQWLTDLHVVYFKPLPYLGGLTALGLWVWGLAMCGAIVRMLANPTSFGQSQSETS